MNPAKQLFYKELILLQKGNSDPDYGFIKDFFNFKINRKQLKEHLLQKQKDLTSRKVIETTKETSWFLSFFDKAGFQYETLDDELENICQKISSYEYSANQRVTELLNAGENGIVKVHAKKLEFGDVIKGTMRVIIDDHPSVREAIGSIQNWFQKREHTKILEMLHTFRTRSETQYHKHANTHKGPVPLSSFFKNNILYCLPTALTIQLAVQNLDSVKECYTIESDIKLTEYDNPLEDQIFNPHAYNLLSKERGKYVLVDYTLSKKQLTQIPLTRCDSEYKLPPFISREGIKEYIF